MQQPIVYHLIRDHNLVVNIRRADVDLRVGWMILELTGTKAQQDAGRGWLEQMGVAVADVGGDVLAG